MCITCLSGEESVHRGNAYASFHTIGFHIELRLLLNHALTIEPLWARLLIRFMNFL